MVENTVTCILLHRKYSLRVKHYLLVCIFIQHVGLRQIRCSLCNIYIRQICILLHISMSILANNIKISRSEKPQKNAKKPTICRIANVSWLDLETLLLHSYKPNRPTSTKILAQILFRYSSNIVVRLTSILTCYSSACVCLKVDATNKTVWKKFCLSKVS